MIDCTVPTPSDQANPGNADRAPAGSDPSALLSSELSAEALQRRLRLICDLAEALATQTEGVRRHPQALAQVGQAGKLVDPLAEHTARLQRVAGRLRRSLDELEGTAREVTAGEQPAATGPTAATPFEPRRSMRGPEVAPSNPAESVALELRLEGSTREQVERYLMEAFDLDNASEITELVFGRTKSAERPVSRLRSITGSKD